MPPKGKGSDKMRPITAFYSLAPPAPAVAPTQVSEEVVRRKSRSRPTSAEARELDKLQNEQNKQKIINSFNQIMNPTNISRDSLNKNIVDNINTKIRDSIRNYNDHIGFLAFQNNQHQCERSLKCSVSTLGHENNENVHCNCCFICGFKLLSSEQITDGNNPLYPNCEHFLPFFSGAVFLTLQDENIEKYNNNNVFSDLQDNN